MSATLPFASYTMEDENKGLEALHKLKTTEPTLYLTPSPELSKAVRLASEYVFAIVSPYAPKSSLCRLYTEGFDAEQIWQQIDLQARPLLSKLRQRVKNFEKGADEIAKQFNFEKSCGKEEGSNDAVIDEEEDGDEDDECEMEEGEQDDDEEEGAEGEEAEPEDHTDHNRAIQSANAVEDDFLKIKELEGYLLEDEAREYGINKKRKGERHEETGADEDSGDELGLLMGLADDGDDDEIKYEDFFGNGRNTKRKKTKSSVGSDVMDMDDHFDDGDYDQKGSLSTHEKEQQRLQSEIKKLEKANLEPREWTMQGEVTAAKRPKNSALEVDLDFDPNVRPVPVITEEVTESLEELIKKRIAEGRFDDIQKRPSLPNKAPREKIELDESKSKRSLAELYEDEYAQKTGLVSNARSFAEEQKKEASLLFKNLCVKLDALSHFYFTPKPVIEDMSIQANVPALAFEEVAPLAVSDAAMLAPEEVFSSKGDMKEEAELTKADRKRKRAKNKRRMKAEAAKRAIIRPRLSTTITKTMA